MSKIDHQLNLIRCKASLDGPPARDAHLRDRYPALHSEPAVLEVWIIKGQRHLVDAAVKTLFVTDFFKVRILKGFIVHQRGDVLEMQRIFPKIDA